MINDEKAQTALEISKAPATRNEPEEIQIEPSAEPTRDVSKVKPDQAEIFGGRSGRYVERGDDAFVRGREAIKQALDRNG